MVRHKPQKIKVKLYLFTTHTCLHRHTHTVGVWSWTLTMKRRVSNRIICLITHPALLWLASVSGHTIYLVLLNILSFSVFQTLLQMFGRLQGHCVCVHACMHVQGSEKEPHFLLLKVCQKSIPAALLYYVSLSSSFPSHSLHILCPVSLYVSQPYCLHPAGMNIS